ncbi:unnamed protein product [Polarella glacialis]|uniref:J domain-containing protein n=1 Tax=Polarella glacialis TaxID=89957 RepID=A0A813LYX0_POLGL|nr:unnamed protein product [Polarella glacialis]
MQPTSSARRAKSCFAAVESSKLPLLTSSAHDLACVPRPSSVNEGLVPAPKRRGGSSSLPPLAGGKAAARGLTADGQLPARSPVASRAVDRRAGGGIDAASGEMGVKGFTAAAAKSFGYGRPTSGGVGRPPRAPAVEAAESTAKPAPEVRAAKAPRAKALAAAAKDGVKSPLATRPSESTWAATATSERASHPKVEASTGKENVLREFVSKDAQSVLDEETVTYSWRRRGPAEAPKESALESKSVAAQQESTCRQPGRLAVEQASGSHVDSVLGSRGSQPQRAGRGVRFVGGESQAPKEAQPVANSSSSSESTGRRAAKSTALVPRGHGSQPTDGGPGAGSSSGGSSSGSSGFVRCDIGEAMQLRDTRLGPAGGAVSSLPAAPAALSPAVRLVAYDGQPFPQLAAGALSNCSGKGKDAAAAPPWLGLWLTGTMSGELACILVDDWLQGEVAWPDAPSGELQRKLGCVAGMLADVSLQRVPTAWLHQAIFALSPQQAASASILVVLEASGKDVERRGPKVEDLLVSEVELALSRLEARALGGQEGEPAASAARLEALVRREMLRHLWCDDNNNHNNHNSNNNNERQGCGSRGKDVAGETRGREGGGHAQLDDDSWLLEQLRRSPQVAEEKIMATGLAELRRENQLLDHYLVRLLRLKRCLVTLLDEWEKVDHYAILGVLASATDRELKSAYRKACLRLHPDKGGDKAQFQQLQDSYARVLEERAKQPPSNNNNNSNNNTNSNNSNNNTSNTNSTNNNNNNNNDNNKTAAQTAARSNAPPSGKQLALNDDSSDERARGNSQAGRQEAVAEVLAAGERLRSHAEAALQAMEEAENADALLKNLKRSQGAGGVEALCQAQQAGETLLSLSEKLGEMGPELGEAAMEVAENSLSLAARYAAVPMAMLLTDVALSCTFEASRMQHNALQLLEIRRDTEGTLQTLKTNLSMAKIIGSCDAETLKLSLGLVSKAASRMMASLRQMTNAVSDALQRGRQCLSHARTVVSFAAGRSAAETEAREDPAQAALPAPEAATDLCGGSAGKAGAEGSAPAPAAAPGFCGQHAGSAAAAQQRPVDHGLTAEAAARQGRLQNDCLLRQLNKELLELQSRARAHLAKQRGTTSSFSAFLPAEDSARIFRLAAEVLMSATEAVLDAFEPSVARLRGALFCQMGFVEACGEAAQLAAPVDFRAQLLRLAVMIDSQVVLGALERQVKPRLAARCKEEPEEVASALLAALDRHFERLSTAIVSARMA